MVYFSLWGLTIPIKGLFKELSKFAREILPEGSFSGKERDLKSINGVFRLLRSSARGLTERIHSNIQEITGFVGELSAVAS